MAKKEKQVRVGGRSKVEDPKVLCAFTMDGSLARLAGCITERHPVTGQGRIKPGTAKGLQRTIVDLLKKHYGAI